MAVRNAGQPLTRWTAELSERTQEYRFRCYSLRNDRTTALLALSGIVAMIPALWISLIALGSVRPTAPTVTAITGLVVGGMVSAVVLAKAQRPRLIFRTVVVSIIIVTTAIVALLANGLAFGAPGACLVFGGTIVVYLSVPLTMVGTMVSAWSFSAATLSTYLVAGAGSSIRDMVWTVGGTALAHVLGAVEARRRQCERRLLFAQRETLRELSAVDPLTGLANRRTFGTELGAAWDRWLADGTPVCLLMIDVDHFKNFNDTFGHGAGDRALQRVAGAIRTAMLPTPDATAARYGGEEFTCLLTGVELAEAETAAERVRTEVRCATASQRDPRTGVTTPLTVSVGVAGTGIGSTLAQDLVDRADSQLYRAKRAGRDRVHVDRRRPQLFAADNFEAAFADHTTFADHTASA